MRAGSPSCCSWRSLSSPWLVFWVDMMVLDALVVDSLQTVLFLRRQCYLSGCHQFWFLLGARRRHINVRYTAAICFTPIAAGLWPWPSTLLPCLPPLLLLSPRRLFDDTKFPPSLVSIAGDGPELKPVKRGMTPLPLTMSLLTGAPPPLPSPPREDIYATVSRANPTATSAVCTKYPLPPPHPVAGAASPK